MSKKNFRTIVLRFHEIKKKKILFRSDVFAVGPSGVLKLITLSFSTKLSAEQVSTLFCHFIFLGKDKYLKL